MLAGSQGLRRNEFQPIVNFSEMDIDYNTATVAELVHRTESGDERARNLLFSRVFFRPISSEDKELALQSFRRLAEAGDSSIQECLGSIHYMLGEYAEAARWYRLVNDQQPGYAQRKLVECYFNDPGASEADRASALQLLFDAARAGDAKAQEELFDLCCLYLCLRPNPAWEAKWYEVAAWLLRSCPFRPSAEAPHGVTSLDLHHLAEQMDERENAPAKVKKAVLALLRRAENEDF